MSEFESYQNPLNTRYASAEMSRIWSSQTRHATWRRLWVALAESQQELGLEISDEQVASLREAIDDIDFDVAAGYERDLRHDVMAHVHAYGDRCPEARGIIHLGATSCFVTDNTDLLLLGQALELIRDLSRSRFVRGDCLAQLFSPERFCSRSRWFGFASWHCLPSETVTCPAWASLTCNRPNRRPLASERHCGATTW